MSTCFRIAVSVVSLLSGVGVVPASASVLTGSGRHLPMPNPYTGLPPLVERPVLSSIVHPTSFVGTWSLPAAPAWVGSFNVLGVEPSSSNSGSTSYDFSTLPGGVLPAGTFFIFGDVDGGSGPNEQITLRAEDSLHSTISAAWLDNPVSVWGTLPILPLENNLPGWDFSSSIYTIDGSTTEDANDNPFGLNPNASFALVSNAPITYLELFKADTNCGFLLAAPLVPAPGAGALLGLAAAVVARRRR